ncbi:hypothetical protein ALP58_102420 [Pseudomonas savastanoi]|uniref:Uncharacterized protein n=2 Tax=Pseudomonas syringae group TaxID=136849 RepID=A0A0P9N661_PSESX|nr:Uncharacterized protein ALO79_03315 [Pseudomonas syringae pv. castaneae]RMS83976.1 hypothetical protein ALP58_102420 [Pseudomonas savastanoi]
MPKPSTRAPIPQIEMIKKGGQWEVHWDYQEGPASLVLFNRAEYLRGYIDGVLDMLRIAPERVCCASGVTGTVKRLDDGFIQKCTLPAGSACQSQSA